MTKFDSAALERAVTDSSIDLEQRDVRALTQYLTVLPEGPDIYTVVSESGNSYTVDTREERCTCPDHQYRDVRCKHLRRVALATGDTAIPAWVDPDAIDPQLGEHTDETPRVAATDGGTEIIEAGDEGEILDADRPDECSCHPKWADDAPPCWPCYREGFETPNPDAGDNQ